MYIFLKDFDVDDSLELTPTSPGQDAPTRFPIIRMDPDCIEKDVGVEENLQPAPHISSIIRSFSTSQSSIGTDSEFRSLSIAASLVRD